MTLEQCKRLKEMGFPQGTGVSAYWELSKDRIELWHTRNLHMATEICCNPTAEEALDWVAGKLTEKGFVINFLISENFISTISTTVMNAVTNEKKFIEIFDTLSDAVYALIEWAHENKLLEA